MRDCDFEFEAADAVQTWSELHAAIRDARKAYQADGTVPDWEGLGALVQDIKPS